MFTHNLCYSPHFMLLMSGKLLSKIFELFYFIFFNEYFNFDKIIKNNKKINSEFLKN